MICNHCGRMVKDGALTCEYCGTFLGRYSDAGREETGVRAIRQGRMPVASQTLPSSGGDGIHELGDFELNPLPADTGNRSATRQRDPSRSGMGVPVHASGADVYYGKDRKVSYQRVKGSRKKQKRVNWMLMLVIVAFLGIASFAGYKIYLKKSDSGQHSLARKYTVSASESDFELLSLNSTDADVVAAQAELLEKWGDVKGAAYWEEGQEYLGVGDIAAAITCFRIADRVDPENYDGLLMLANAYELDEQNDMAEAVYRNLITGIAPARTDGYTALINLLKSTDREQEAADLMQTAYQNTDKDTFRLQRIDFIPQTPVVDLTAGRYELGDEGLRITRKNVKGDIERITKVIVSSPQGYDVYYALNEDAVLPEEGKLVERVILEDGTLGYDGLELEEGTLTIRAVAVSGNLRSDEFRATYTFYYPTPPAPYANLAPGTYKTLHEVKLKAGENTDKNLTRAELAERESYYQYYYTVDGSMPTQNSPKYDGTPIKLPTGRVTLKAICVNKYDKESSVLEIGYKFTVAPYLPSVYEEADLFSGFTLNKTTIDQFTAAFGKPSETIPSRYYSLPGSCQHLVYPWGYAVFYLQGTTWQLVRVETNKDLCAGPRGASIGKTESEITSLFRDYGQPANADDTRGLYYDYPRVGQILIREDGTRVIQYQLETAASNRWVLEFALKNGRVAMITHYYAP